MKKLLLISAVVILTAGFYGCGDNNTPSLPKNQFQVNQNDLKGEIPAGDEISLEAKTYKLTGALIVKSGASLTIPAGAVISATPTTSADAQVRYIAVERGAKIYIKGTSASPVVMTSDTKASSSWGGLVICGAAPTNLGDQSKAEVSELNYGGSKVDDNSGIISNLRVEFTGYKYSDTKEFNGVSLFGVGSGTIFENITSYKGGDDGIEFFGGSVIGKNLLSIDSEDDGIDFADGWSGNGENWFVRNASKSLIEGSNNGNNGGATPMTNAKLKNLTLLGCGEKPFYMKEGAGKQTVDNIIIGGLANGKTHPYFYADKTDTYALERVKAGDIKITNVKFVNIGSVAKVFDSALTITENASATGAGNGENRPAWVSDSMNKTTDGKTIF